MFGRLDAPALLLYAGSIAWVIGYDTIYAHQDREDDALIGVKSTARLFGTRTRPVLLGFYALAVLLIGLAGAAAGAGPVFVVGCILFGAHLGWQIDRLDIDDPGSMPAAVQVEPRRRPDPVRRADRGCAIQMVFPLTECRRNEHALQIPDAGHARRRARGIHHDDRIDRSNRRERP